MARFYETSYIQPKSAYVPLPFEAMAAKLQTMQASQDAYKQSIDAFDQYIPNLEVDKFTAEENKRYVQEELDKIREFDFNDSSNRKDIYKGIKKIRDFYSPQGGYGLQKARYDSYYASKKQIEDNYKDNPTQKEILLRNLDRQFLNQEGKIDFENKALRLNKETNQWENTGISKPDEWTWVDREKWASDTLKDIEYDQNYANYGFSDVAGMQSAVKAFREGNTQHKDYNKIVNAMIMRAQGNPNLLKTSQEEAIFYGYGDQSNWLMQDEKGNTVLNPQTLLGSTIMGTASGGQFERRTANTEFIKDDVADAAAKKRIEDPLAFIGQEVPATNYTNFVDDGEKLQNKMQVNNDSTKAAWVQMMLDAPQNWGKFGVKDNDGDGQVTANDVSVIYDGIVSKGGGINWWMNTNGSLFEGSGRVNTLLAENKKLSIVDQAANNYAAKVAPRTGKLANLTDADEQEFKAASQSTVTGVRDFNKALAISKKYGYNSIAEMEEDMNVHSNKYSSAKNNFIKQNAATISKQTWGEGVMPVLNPDGSVNEKATYDINKTVDGYFTDDKSLMNIVSLEPKDPNNPEAGYYTLYELKMMEQAKAKEEGSTQPVKVSKPWYATLPDSDGNPIMYTNIGGKAVPINSNSITVTYQKAPGEPPTKTTLGQLNASPDTSTNIFLSGVYASGSGTEKVGGYPLESNPNVKIFTASAPQNGSWSGGSSLKVVQYNTNGQPKLTLQGQDAFSYLKVLQTQNLLK